MKNGLAIWHYPHRTVLENVCYFAEQGFDSVSIKGSHMEKICLNDENAEQLANLINDKNITLTVHHALPADHSEEIVSKFKLSMDRIACWQKKYGCVSILSFDVPQNIRDNITPYIEYVLNAVPQSKIAIEDFGLTQAEKFQIEGLKLNKRFGFLLDVGHLYLRIRGKNDSGLTLFTNSPEECPVNENPGYHEFLRAFKSKEFPIFEIHLHNNDGKEDLHYFLEDGPLNIDIIASVLKEIGFDGVLTIESAPGYKFKCAYPESDMRISKTFSYWKELNA